MNKFSICCFLLLVLYMPGIKAQETIEWGRQAVRLSFYSGYGRQDFRWSIAGNYQGRNPNIYSELKWQGLRGPIAGADLWLRVRKRWYAAVQAACTSTLAGQVTDADYAGDNRTGRSYLGVFNSNKGGSFLLEAKPGYCLLRTPSWFLVVCAGYEYQFRDMRILENARDTSVIADHLSSAYRARLAGPLLGAHLSYKLTGKLTLSFLPECSFLYYSGQADWNLVTYFKHPLSFEHLGNGLEWKGHFAAHYQVHGNLRAFLAFDYRRLQVHGGEDVLYLADGQILKSHFNGASGNALAALAGITLLMDKDRRERP